MAGVLDFQARKFQFTAFQVTEIVCDDSFSGASEGEFNKVVVGFVWKVWPPQKILFDPVGDGEECFEQRLSFFAGEVAFIHGGASDPRIREIVCREIVLRPSEAARVPVNML